MATSRTRPPLGQPRRNTDGQVRQQVATQGRSSPTSRPGHMRIGPVAALPRVLSDLGVEPGTVFTAADVSLAAFADPGASISIEAVARLLEIATEHAGCPHIGLLVGERFALKDLGEAGQLMVNSPTVRDALRMLLLTRPVQNRGGVPVFSFLDPDTSFLGYSIYWPGTPDTGQIYDVAIAIALVILRELCGAKWKPLFVQFAHMPPEDLHPYHRLFGSNPRFDANISGIAFATDWLDHRIAGADPEVYESISRSSTLATGGAAIPFSEQVLRLLHQMIPAGSATSTDVAWLFGSHERTLRKRLAAEGTTLHRLVGQAKFEIARQLLENTQLTATEIAETLRYAALSHFSRAFKAWAGVSPEQYRNAL